VDSVLQFSEKVLCAEIFAINLKTEAQFQKIVFCSWTKKEYTNYYLPFQWEVFPCFSNVFWTLSNPECGIFAVCC